MSAMKWQRCTRRITLLISCAASTFTAQGQDQASSAVTSLKPVHRAQMCVTKGAIEKGVGAKMEVTVPEMRAVAAYPTRFVAEARFTYLGPTKQTKPLGSGEIRHVEDRAQAGAGDFRETQP